MTTTTSSTPKACISDARIASARRYARSRPGSVSFAVFVGGQIRSDEGSVRYRSASLVKAMLLVADLRRHAGDHAPLTRADRARLHAMIHVSDNAAATATYALVGSSGLTSVAHLAGMRNYTLRGSWGTSELTATDQARFWGRLNAVLPAQYRSYARSLLRGISAAQVWGGAPVARSHGYSTMFKSGWLPRTDGWVVHQGLRLERGRCTVGIAVLTGGDASMATGVASIRGVVSHLLG
ncbi:MAG: serine hydrolase [Solirubrobacteraceae bacterium]|nr:serine hydrolase [Patulibacter sp.]